MGEVGALSVEDEEAVAVALVVGFGGAGATDFFGGVEALEGEDGEAVDHHAGGFGVERSGLGGGWSLVEENEVDFFGEVVAALVEGVDGALVASDGVAGGEGIAGGVFVVPEVEVGAVLGEDEVVPCVGGRWLRG